MKHRTPTLHEARARVFWLTVGLCIYYGVRGATHAELLIFLGTELGLFTAAASLYIPQFVKGTK